MPPDTPRALNTRAATTLEPRPRAAFCESMLWIGRGRDHLRPQILRQFLIQVSDAIIDPQANQPNGSVALV
jgi:hypothetical protein